MPVRVLSNEAKQRKRLTKAGRNNRVEAARNTANVINHLGLANVLADHDVTLGLFLTYLPQLHDPRCLAEFKAASQAYHSSCDLESEGGDDLLVRLPRSAELLATTLVRMGLHRSHHVRGRVIEMRGHARLSDVEPLVARAGGQVIELALPVADDMIDTVQPGSIVALHDPFDPEDVSSKCKPLGVSDTELGATVGAMHIELASLSQGPVAPETGAANEMTNGVRAVGSQSDIIPSDALAAVATASVDRAPTSAVAETEDEAVVPTLQGPVLDATRAASAGARFNSDALPLGIGSSASVPYSSPLRPPPPRLPPQSNRVWKPS